MLLHECHLLPGAEFFVAIDNAGLWPKVIKVDKTLFAAGYNYPGHAVGNGNIAVWQSDNGGALWHGLSVASKHGDKPDFVRNNHAMGVNAKGELIIVVGGWSNNLTQQEPIQVCISQDMGRSWSQHEIDDVIGHPYGSILLLPDDRLVCAIHDDEPRRSFLYWSEDHGKTWGDRSLLVENGTETSLLQCSDGSTWLAAVRMRPHDDYVHPENNRTAIFKSTDQGKHWQKKGTVSSAHQSPGDLLELDNGKILLTYGSRIDGTFGVVMRLSDDKGESWSDPETLISIPCKADCGYPSSVQLDDGTIVTAYYFGPPQQHDAGGTPWHHRYHMGVARWKDVK